MRLRHAICLFLTIVFFPACTARPMVCTLVKADGAPALGCVDARGIRVQPYDGVPAPQLPERESPSLQYQRLGPYWQYDGWEKDQERTSIEGGGGVCCVYNGKWTCRLCSLGE